jgi:hypothetical protein
VHTFIDESKFVIINFKKNSMRKISFLLALLLICSGALFAREAKTNGTVIGRVDRSTWQTIAVSSETASDGGGMGTLLDGNHNNYWHSQWNPTAIQPPHWAVIDLGEGGAQEFTAFQIYKRWNTTAYQQTVQIYVGNDTVFPTVENPLPADNGWTLIGEGVQPNSGAFRMLTVETPGSAANQGRYLLFYFPDSYSTNVCVAEIYGLGQIEDNLYGGTPYPDAPHEVPGVIEAEDFDRGGNSVGYSWFSTDRRKSQEEVKELQAEDPELTFDYSDYRWDAEDGDAYILDGPGDDNRHLGHFNQPGEYLNYTINVAENGHYDLALSAAVSGADRFLQLLLDGMPLLADYDVVPVTKPVNAETGLYPIVNTGDWEKYMDNLVERVYLTAGKHVLRVYGHFDFDKITVTKSYLGIPFKEANTLPLTANAPPFVLQAEDFDEADGYTDMTYHVATPATNTYRPNTTANIAEGLDGDYHLVTGNGDWYSYTINVSKDKFYEFVFSFYGQRAAASNYLAMEVNGEIIEELTDNIEFPTSYDEPIEVYMPLTLKEGKNIIKVKTNGGNLDKIEITKAPFDYKGGPFYGTPYIVPAVGNLIFEAEYFDIGGEGISYHDSDASNSGTEKELRADAPGVDIEPLGTEGNYNIGWSNAGEWLAYSLDIEEEGNYDIFITMSTNNDVRKQHIEIDDVAYPEISAQTSAWANYTDFATTNVILPSGRHTLYLYYNGNIDKIKIKRHKEVLPYENTPQVIPGTIQAWKFDEGGDGLTFAVTNNTLGGASNAIRNDVEVPIRGSEAEGYYIDVVEANTPSWLNYTVDVKETGYYKVTFKVGCDTGGEKFTLKPASNAWRPYPSRGWYASIVLPAAEGEWRDVIFPIMKLNKGIDTLKLAGSGIWNIKYASITFEPVTDVVDRSNWTVADYSSMDPNDKGTAPSNVPGVNASIDDDFGSFWHAGSTAPTELPHWIIYDLGSPVEISQIILFRRQSNPDVITVEWSAGNDLANHESWPLIATGEYPESQANSGYLDLALTLDQPTKVRYLKLYMPDSNERGTFTNVTEVIIRGKEFPVRPFNGPHTVPGIVQAEDFDTGGEGNAFHTSNPGTSTYRPDETVHIAAGPEGDYHLVTGTGDWYIYTIEVPNKAYNYEFVFYGEKASADFLTVQVNGIVIAGVTDSIAFPSAYGTPTVVSTPIKLRKGKNTITIKSDGGNLDKFEIRPAEYQGTPFFETVATAPGRIEVEDFDLGGEGIAFHDTEPTNNAVWAAYRPELEGGPSLEERGTGITIGSTRAGEWIAYTVEFPKTGLYNFALNVSTDNQNRIAGISIDNGATDTTTVKTTGWADFQDFDINGISVTAGIHQVYLELESINIDYFEIKNSTGIDNIISVPVGKVYTEGRMLKVKEFSASASLVVYNLLGQKIANYKTMNGGVEVYLPAQGIYIVKVQDKGVSASYKVIAR